MSKEEDRMLKKLLVVTLPTPTTNKNGHSDYRKKVYRIEQLKRKDQRTYNAFVRKGRQLAEAIDLLLETL